MGVYYLVCNIHSKQYIDPSKVDDGWCNEGSLIFGNTAKLVMFKMLYGWDLSTVVGNYDVQYFDVKELFEDITKPTIDAFNSRYTEKSIIFKP